MSGQNQPQKNSPNHPNLLEQQFFKRISAVITVLLILILFFLIRGRGPKKRMEGFITDLNKKHVPEWGNGKEFIVIHYTGIPADGHAIPESGIGAHFYIYGDGTIYQTEPVDAVMWQVGTADGRYSKLREDANNHNCIGIEMCTRCDGNPDDIRDEKWYLTEETQMAAVRLTRRLMNELNIPADHVIRHGDIVDKWCPAPHFNNNHYKTSWTWDEFKEHLASFPEEDVPKYPIV
ncbi:MAG: N-acetylmuramoyl-L-alanine amidase [Lachnospiraceae bacterium]|nr:N-acetylmuramoyl-L-alanine amidase [Lachnospiraceae bacterium]